MSLDNFTTKREKFPRGKMEEKMLKSLVGTGLQARLSHEQYKKYEAEISAIEARWVKSLHYLETCDFAFTGGVENKYISTPYCQYDYGNIIYDHRECRTLSPDEVLPDGYHTMLDGGTVPCAIMSILDYFRTSPKSLEEIGKILVTNGYRTKLRGTLWIAFEKILEHYHVRTQILPTIFDLCESVSLNRPVIALVSAAWLHQFPHPYMMTNECVIVWRLEGKKAVITTTSNHSLIQVNLYDLLKNTRRAWSCQKFS